MKIAFIGGGGHGNAIADRRNVKDAEVGDSIIPAISKASLKRWQDKGMPHVQIGASERFAEASLGS